MHKPASNSHLVVMLQLGQHLPAAALELLACTRHVSNRTSNAICKAAGTRHLRAAGKRRHSGHAPATLAACATGRRRSSSEESEARAPWDNRRICGAFEGMPRQTCKFCESARSICSSQAVAASALQAASAALAVTRRLSCNMLRLWEGPWCELREEEERAQRGRDERRRCSLENRLVDRRLFRY